MTVTIPTVYYANSAGYSAITAWHQPWTPTVGTITRATAPTILNERCFICIVSGAVGATEPTWSTTKGVKTTDSSATWMECTGQPALNADLGNTPLSSQNRSGAQLLGNIITDNSQTHIFICTTAGTTGASEPTYVTTAIGNTTTDSGCTWTYIGTSFSSWSAPFSRLNNSNSYIGANYTLYVSSSHAETQAAALNIQVGSGVNPATNIVCIQNAGSFPPTASNITTGASVTTTGNFVLTLAGCMAINGIAFSCGSGAVAPIFTLGSLVISSYLRLVNCSLSIPTSASSSITIIGVVDLVNTTINFGSNANQTLTFGTARFTWRDTPSALSASTWPSLLFSSQSSGGIGSVLIENVDLSAYSGSALFTTAGDTAGRLVFSHCKLPSTIFSGTTFTGNSLSVVDIVNSDTGGNTYNTQRYGPGVAQTMSTTVVASSGASDGTTSYAWRFVSAPNAISWTVPFESIPISIWNTTTGANVTITLQGAYVGTALPNNDDIWFDVTYFGTSSSTAGTRATSTKATLISSDAPWSSSSTLWGSAAPARQNSHSYVVGDAIGVSSASSIVRAFVCTTAGSSSGSLPGAYATAVDGTQVTDNVAVFTAVERFSMALTLSSPQPQAAGYLVIYIKVAKQSSFFYIDPKPVLS